MHVKTPYIRQVSDIGHQLHGGERRNDIKSKSN